MIFDEDRAAWLRVVGEFHVAQLVLKYKVLLFKGHIFVERLFRSTAHLGPLLSWAAFPISKLPMLKNKLDRLDAITVRCAGGLYFRFTLYQMSSPSQYSFIHIRAWAVVQQQERGNGRSQG